MRSSAVARRRSADMSRAARTRRAAIRRSRTIPAATGIAQSARPRRHADGWPTAKRSCCRRASRSNFLVHVNVLARLFRGKMLAMLMARVPRTAPCSGRCCAISPVTRIVSPSRTAASSIGGCRAHPPERLLSPLCSRWLTTRRMGEDAPHRPLPRTGWALREGKGRPFTLKAAVTR